MSKRSKTVKPANTQAEREIQAIIANGQEAPFVDEVALARARRSGPGRRASETSPGIPSQAEYERREFADVIRRRSEVQGAPLADRKDAQQSFLEAMKEDPGHVANVVDWLIDGHYQ